MRRLAGILLTVATIAAVMLTFTSGEAGASRAAVSAHGSSRRATAADKHMCESFDHLIRFLRQNRKPSALKSREGRQVLAALDSGQPRHVARQFHTIVRTFSKLRDGGTRAITKAQDRAASEALFRASVYAATACRQKTVRAFASAMVQSRISKAESASSTTTTP